MAAHAKCSEWGDATMAAAGGGDGNNGFLEKRTTATTAFRRTFIATATVGAVMIMDSTAVVRTMVAFFCDDASKKYGTRLVHVVA